MYEPGGTHDWILGVATLGIAQRNPISVPVFGGDRDPTDLGQSLVFVYPRSNRLICEVTFTDNRIVRRLICGHRSK